MNKNNAADYIDLYGCAPILQRALVRARRLICPPEIVLSAAPKGARALDVGCGVGANLIYLAQAGMIAEGFGVDIHDAAIAVARRAANKTRCDVAFAVIQNVEELPEACYDVVLVIDVLHHIAPARQMAFFRACAARVAAGGLLIYKDMARKPAWMAAANRLHDLVLARQWIHYAPLDDVRFWAREAGLHPREERRFTIFWYAHELIVFERPASLV